MDQGLPFYITWSQQKNAVTFPIESVNDWTFVSNGKEITDLSSISFQASFGLNNQKIKDEIKKQFDVLPMTSPKATFDLKMECSKDLLKFLKKDEGKIFYTVSGAESVENALKMMRQIKNRKYVLALDSSYHGATLGALSVTGDWRNQSNITNEWTLRIPSYLEDPDCLKTRKIIEEFGPEKIAGFCLETITGINGVHMPPESWYLNIQNLCKEFDLGLILDEVICGFCRTGKGFGLHHYPSLKPDFICLAKAISGGYIPFGAVWTSKEVANYYEENVLACGLTNYAHPIGLAALKAVLEICQSKEFVLKLNENIKVLNEFLKSISDTPAVTETRSVGMLAAIEFGETPSWSDYYSKGFYLACRDKRIVLAPMLNTDTDFLKESLDKLGKVIKG